MKSSHRIIFILLTGLLLFSTWMPVLAAGQNPQRTLFKDIPANDPKRQIIQSILDSPFYSMKGMFSSREWRSGHYGGAWERARQYFPNHVYFTESAEHFMTHFFNPNGKLEMEIYNSAFLNLCVQNRRTFTNENIVGEYNRMRGSDPQAAKAFQEKLGKLESYFRDEASKNKLKKMLGDRLYNHLLEELREENHHMLAGALMHEGMHAKMDDDELVKRIQNEYGACNLPVQWDELRSYMTEINYHGRFYSWAVNNINQHWGEISKLIAELEALRNRKKPLSDAEKEKIEEIKAKIKAHIALIRLRMRELWQSAQRMNGLMNNFKTEYLKPDAPEEHRDMVDKLTAIIADFVQQVGQSIQRTELLLRELEQYLDLWNEWAACRRDNPPPRQTVRDILREVRRIRWPSPPVGHVDEVKKKAGKQIGKIPGSVPGGRRNIPGSSQGMIISGSYQMSSVSMKSLNEYIPYLNETWQGDVPTFDWEKGFRVSLGWRFTPHFEAGTFFERMTASVSGTFQAFMSRYTSEHTLNVYGLYVSAASDEVFSVLRFVSQAGIGYYDATYREQEDAFVTEGKDHTIGWHTAGGLDIALSENLSVHVMAGYRHAALHEFDTSFFMPGDPPVALEFTGFCGWAGLSFRF